MFFPDFDRQHAGQLFCGFGKGEHGKGRRQEKQRGKIREWQYYEFRPGFQDKSEGKRRD